MHNYLTDLNVISFRQTYICIAKMYLCQEVYATNLIRISSIGLRPSLKQLKIKTLTLLEVTKSALHKYISIEVCRTNGLCKDHVSLAQQDIIMHDLS